MKRRTTAVLALGSAVLLAITGCATGQSGSEEDQTLIVAGPATALALDPYGDQAMEDATLVVDAHIYDTLVKYENREALPSLAVSWTTPDDLTWLFELRDDVTFHDGTPFTAASVEAAFGLVGGGLASLFAPFESVTALSDTEVEVKTKIPFGGVPVVLSMLPITAEGREAEGIGTGPFKVGSFAPGENLVLERYDDYWGEPAGVSKIEFRNIPEESSRVTALLNGEIDLTWGLSPDQFTDVENAEGVEFITAPSFQHYYAWFNAQHEPFDDPKVRQAMIHAINWDAIMESLFPGVAERASAPIPSSVFGFSANPIYEYSPELAKELLTEAGYPDGFSTSMQYSITCCSQIEELAQAVAADLAKVGVTVDVQGKEVGTWVEDFLALDWDINIANNVAVTGDANFTIGRLYPCAANRTGFCSQELDDLIAAAQSTIDDEERAALWGEAGALIWNEAVGTFPFDVDQNYAFRTSVTNFDPGASGNPSFTTVQIKR